MSSALRLGCTVKFSGTRHKKTLPSSEPEAISESLKGFLGVSVQQRADALQDGRAYQSVSSTTAVCPLNNGILSGTLPLSSTGMTANAPPPLASQLTEIYSGFAWTRQTIVSELVGHRVELAYLDQIGVPCVPRHSEVVIALFLSCIRLVLGKGLGRGFKNHTLRVGRPKTWRYLDCRTNRPAMIGKFTEACMYAQDVKYDGVEI